MPFVAWRANSANHFQTSQWSEVSCVFPGVCHRFRCPYPKLRELTFRVDSSGQPSAGWQHTSLPGIKLDSNSAAVRISGEDLLKVKDFPEIRASAELLSNFIPGRDV